MKFSAKIRKRINTLLKFFLIVGVYLALFYELKNYDWSLWQQPDLLSEHWQQWLIFAVVLMFFNWGLEGVKWQYLMRKIECVSHWIAIKAVFVGMAISIFTPNRIGDYLGRVFILRKGDRLDGVVATIGGNLAQLLVTLVMGSVGLLYFAEEINQNLLHWQTYQLWLLRIAAVLIDVFILYIYFNTIYLEQKFSTWLKLYRYPILKHLKTLSNFSRANLLSLLLMSFGRYFIYASQYYILFQCFGAELSYTEGFFLTAVLLFALTIVPTVAVAELGVRGLLSVYVVELLFAAELEPIAVVASSSALWMINLAIPAMLGGVFVFELKFLRPKIDYKNS